MGETYGLKPLLNKLVELTYERNDIDFKRGTFRYVVMSLKSFLANKSETGIRIEFFGDEIETIKRFDVITGRSLESLNVMTISNTP